MRWSRNWGVISCNTCRYGFHGIGCGYHDNILEGKKYCVDRDYHDWEYYKAELEFIEESEMMI